MIKQKIELVFAIIAIIAVVLIIVIFLSPSPDYDSGPMMIYSFLVFFPLILLAGLLSLISIIIAFIKLVRKKQEKKTIKIISLSLSMPIFIYFLYIVINAIIIENHAYDDLDDLKGFEFYGIGDYSDSIKNQSDVLDSIEVTKNKTIQ